VNSEELEISLRNEIESHLKNVLTQMRQSITELQGSMKSELDRHQNQLNEVFQPFLEQTETEIQIDDVFAQTVAEHLRLAKDEGARITADAMAKSQEQFEDQSYTDFTAMRDAVLEISNQNSQSEILKALVRHASSFAPRGAFFIVKNDHFVGWRTFGSENPSNDQTVKEVFIPTSEESILAASMHEGSTQKDFSNAFSADESFLTKLHFDNSYEKVAVPLVVRGRTVAVLFADTQPTGLPIRVEALETIVRVASLTVELRASEKGVAHKPAEDKKAVKAEKTTAVFEADRGTGSLSMPQMQTTDFESPKTEEEDHEHSWSEPAMPSVEAQTVHFDAPETAEVPSEYNVPTIEVESPDFQPPTFETTPGAFKTQFESTPSFTSEFEPTTDFSPASTPGFSQFEEEPGFSADRYETSKLTFPTPEVERYDVPSFVPVTESVSVETQAYSPSATETAVSYEDPAPSVSFTAPTPAVAPQPEPPPAVTTPTISRRFNDRNMDLPIEVSEDERRLHNDARRFARLLVSEIKLYNEQKVKEGRESSDLYERLREAIDRSREMYDKRVQPSVASRFDYFHFELVNTLAEGETGKLGVGYPGAAV
jgi:hypothetical protein